RSRRPLASIDSRGGSLGIAGGGPDGPPPRIERTVYFVVPVPLMSNGAAASDCSELPSSRRRRTGVCWSLPPKKVDRPVIEYMPAPGLIPRSLALVVNTTVHGDGGVVAKHVPPTVAVCVGLYSSVVI